MKDEGPRLPRVCLLVANTGAGHRSAAHSLAEALQDRAHVTILNLLDDYAPFPWNTVATAYGPWVNYTPWFWRLLYQFGASQDRIAFLERVNYRFVYRHVAPPLLAAEPDLVFTVHPLQITIPLRILRSAGCRTRFVTVVTDPVSPPLAWFRPDVDLCVVATPPAQEVAIASGLDPGKVRVLGLPVRQAFGAAAERAKPEARSRLGLDPHRPLVLLAGGGAGIGRLLEQAKAIAGQLAAHGVPAQLAIVSGRNEALRRRLNAQAWPVPVTVLGFVEEMADWLAAADVLFTKAGPGTLAEAACAGVPVIITGFVPGQETGNVMWFAQHRAGVYEPNPAKAAALVVGWLKPGNPTLGEMAVRTRAMAQPEASAQIVEAALELLDQQEKGIGAGKSTVYSRCAANLQESTRYLRGDAYDRRQHHLD
jgi:1,2-diacylglycerol 3-beta-galactosyltransferase